MLHFFPFSVMSWYTLLTLSSYFFSSFVIFYLCESWTMKNAECWRIDAFELWYWRLLRVSCTAGRSNQSILKEISPEYSLEGLMLKLKLQYSGHLMQRTNSLEKTLMLGKNEDRRRRQWQRMRWLDSIINAMDMSLSRFWDLVMDRETWRAVFHGVKKSQTRLSDWTELNWSTVEGGGECIWYEAKWEISQDTNPCNQQSLNHQTPYRKKKDWKETNQRPPARDWLHVVTVATLLLPDFLYFLMRTDYFSFLN